MARGASRQRPKQPVHVTMRVIKKREGKVDKGIKKDVLGFDLDAGTFHHKHLSYSKAKYMESINHPRYCMNYVKQDGTLGQTRQLHSLLTSTGYHTLCGSWGKGRSASTLTDYGTGVTLYFLYLKYMGVVLAVLSLMACLPLAWFTSLPPNAEFTQGSYYFLGITTLGNIGSALNPVCGEAPLGGTLQLRCPSPQGRIHSVRASYGQPLRGCACPAAATPSLLGVCPNSPNAAGGCAGHCFRGDSPTNGKQCCASKRNPETNAPDFGYSFPASLRNPTCFSGNASAVTAALCVGRHNCAFNVTESTPLVLLPSSSPLPTDSAGGGGVSGGVGVNATLASPDLLTCSGATRRLVVTATCERALSVGVLPQSALFLLLGVVCLLTPLLFVLAVAHLSRREKEVEATLRATHCAASDFTVRFLRLPPHDNITQLCYALKKHLERVLSDQPQVTDKKVAGVRVAEINFGLAGTALMSLYKRRGKVMNELERCEKKIQRLRRLHISLSTVDSFERKREGLKTKLSQVDADIDSWETETRVYGATAENNIEAIAGGKHGHSAVRKPPRRSGRNKAGKVNSAARARRTSMRAGSSRPSLYSQSFRFAAGAGQLSSSSSDSDSDGGGGGGGGEGKQDGVSSAASFAVRTQHSGAARLKAKHAFVTFAEHEGYRRCLALYGGSRLSIARQSYLYRLHGTKLSAHPADEPSAVIWENQGVPFSRRLCRSFVTAALSLILMSFSLALLFLAKRAQLSQQVVYPSVDCAALLRVNGLTSITQRLVYRDENSTTTRQGFLGCYCQEVEATQGLTAMFNIYFQPAEGHLTTGPYWCKDWLFETAKLKAWLLLSSVAVLAVNQLLKQLLWRMAYLERKKSRTRQITSFAVKLFIAQFVNTALLQLWVSSGAAAGGGTLSLRSLSSAPQLRFDPAFYRFVGVPMMITMAFNIFSPHSPTAAFYVFKFCKRCFNRKCSSDVSLTRSVTQRELDDVYLGPKFKLSERYAQTLNTIFVTMLYAPGVPLLLPLALCSVAFTYWIDKVSFLRLYRTPPAYGPDLAKVNRQLLPLAAVAYLAMAAFMLTDPTIFVNAPSVAPSSILAPLSRLSPRLVEPHVVPLTVLLIAVLILLALAALLRCLYFTAFKGDFRLWEKLARAFGPPPKPTFAESLEFPSYHEAVTKGIIKGLHTYDLNQNQEYVRMLALDTLETHHHMRRLGDTGSDAALGLQGEKETLSLADPRLSAGSRNSSGDSGGSGGSGGLPAAAGVGSTLMISSSAKRKARAGLEARRHSNLRRKQMRSRLSSGPDAQQQAATAKPARTHRRGLKSTGGGSSGGVSSEYHGRRRGGVGGASLVTRDPFAPAATASRARAPTGGAGGGGGGGGGYDMRPLQPSRVVVEEEEEEEKAAPAAVPATAAAAAVATATASQLQSASVAPPPPPPSAVVSLSSSTSSSGGGGASASAGLLRSVDVEESVFAPHVSTGEAPAFSRPSLEHSRSGRTTSLSGVMTWQRPSNGGSGGSGGGNDESDSSDSDSSDEMLPPPPPGAAPAAPPGAPVATAVPRVRQERGVSVVVDIGSSSDSDYSDSDDPYAAAADAAGAAPAGGRRVGRAGSRRGQHSGAVHHLPTHRPSSSSSAAAAAAARTAARQ